MSYPLDYSELRHFPLHGSLALTARLDDMWRNAPQQDLAIHVATREKAATILDPMSRELHRWLEQGRSMELRMP